MKKVSIIGAAGNVGASVAMWLNLRKICHTVLIDLKSDVAKGKATDLRQSGPLHGFDFSFEASSELSTIEGSDVVVITAGLPRKPGQTREELIETNAKIVQSVSLEVAKYAPNCIYVIVSNPLDAMVYVAQSVTGFPRNRVIGSAGVLDSSRFQTAIADKLKVSVRDVKAIVLGAHTDKDMVPVVSTATVGGVPLSSLASLEDIKEIVEKTKTGGAELTKLIGTSAWVTPGKATASMVEAIILDEKRVLPCSVELKGELGISNCFLGVPVVLGKEGWSKIISIPLSPEEQLAFEKSATVNQELVKIAKSFI